jgi:hypothetical protein
MNTSLSYSWRINFLAKKNVGITSDVVHVVGWSFIGSYYIDTLLPLDYGEFKGKTRLTIPQEYDGDFITYENLTEENVINWITSSEDMESVYNYIDKDIERKRNQLEIVSGNLNYPWNWNNVGIASTNIVGIASTSE